MTSPSRRSLWLVLSITVLAGGSCDGDATPSDGARSRDVLVVGDSNGVGDQAWPALVAGLLRQECGHEWRVWSESRAGRTLAIDRGSWDTAGILGLSRWLERASASAPDGEVEHLVMALGTNDVQLRFADTAFGTEAYWDAVRSLVSALQHVDVEVSLMLPLPVCGPFIEDAQSEGKWLGAENRLSELRLGLTAEAERAGLPVVEWSDEMHRGVCGLVEPDGVHLNVRGHEAASRAVASHLSGRGVCADPRS